MIDELALHRRRPRSLRPPLAIVCSWKSLQSLTSTVHFYLLAHRGEFTQREEESLRRDVVSIIACERLIGRPNVEYLHRAAWKRAAIFRTITLVFLGGFLHFLPARRSASVAFAVIMSCVRPSVASRCSKKRLKVGSRIQRRAIAQGLYLYELPTRGAKCR